MKENIQHFWHIMLYYLKKENMQLKCNKKICAVYEKCAVTDQMCQKWFIKFHASDLSLDNAPWPGRPVEADSDQIETLIENNQHYTFMGDSRHTQNSQINKLVKIF